MIANLLNALANVYALILLARVIASWVTVDANHPVVSVLIQLTEPVLAPIRSVLPSFGGIDFSPLVALLLLQVIQRVLLGF